MCQPPRRIEETNGPVLLRRLQRRVCRSGHVLAKGNATERSKLTSGVRSSREQPRPLREWASERCSGAEPADRGSATCLEIDAFPSICSRLTTALHFAPVSYNQNERMRRIARPGSLPLSDSASALDRSTRRTASGLLPRQCFTDTALTPIAKM
jgi:hypothetical protein